ncbi:MAG: nitrous oxide reductase accessory protein NosL [Deltaproteobacteria bacterium]|nr:nitrous oxide reductase accessory protein NosL [Deltaproteobacteria bacterium]
MHLAAALSAACLLLAGPEPVKPGPKEKCPVCGMFVARYPDWVAGIRFQDGSRALFDGAKDLFKLLLRVEDYGAVSRRADVASIFVTDYYALAPVDARAAWFVVGSDVLGPMGHELVPFAREAEAREFLRDHRGKQVLRFAEVTPALLKALDGGGP